MTAVLPFAAGLPGAAAGAMARAPDPRTAESALRSDVRRRIVDVVRADPGMPISTLRDRVGLGWGAMYHQVRRLESAGLLQTVVAGRRRVVLPARAASPQVAAAGALLAGATARRVAEIVERQEAPTVHAIAARLGLSERATTYHLRNLVLHGLVESASRSRYVRLRATPLLARLLADRGGGDEARG